MREKSGVASGVGVGGSSILVIFVLLCLTTFATLSMVSAGADLRLTDRTVETVQEYYAADARAEEILARVDGVLRVQAAAAPTQAEPNPADAQEEQQTVTITDGEFVTGDAPAPAAEAPAPDAYFQQCIEALQQEVPEAAQMEADGGLYVRYTVPVNDYQQLSVSVRVLPQDDADGRYRLEQWRLEETGDWEPESGGFELWNPGEDGGMNLSGLPPGLEE